MAVQLVEQVVVPRVLRGGEGPVAAAPVARGLCEHLHEELELLRENASRVTPEPHTTDARATADDA